MSYPFKIPFAASGTQATIPDTDLSGEVNFTDGYTSDYQIDPSNPNAKLVERSKWNFLMNKVTLAIQDVQKFGVPQWFPAADLAPYGIGARVHHAGVYYRSLAANNSSTPGASSTWAVDTPTTASTPNTIPLRDGSGNLASTTAVRLATARTINGVAFDGTSNITVYDYSVPAWSRVAGPSGNSYLRVNGNSTTWQTPAQVKAEINAASGNFDATTAQTLATARNINGVSFNGSSDITIRDNSVPEWARVSSESTQKFPLIHQNSIAWLDAGQVRTYIGAAVIGSSASEVRNNDQLDDRYAQSASSIQSINTETWAVPLPNSVYVMTGTAERSVSLSALYIPDNFKVGESCAIINSTTGSGTGRIITSAGVSVFSAINGSVLVSGDSGVLIMPKGPSVLIYRAANQWILSSM